MRRYLRTFRKAWWREQRVWEVPQGGKEAVRLLSTRLRLSPLLAKVLWARGITSPADACLFLHGSLKDLPEPTSLTGVAEAASLLADAVRRGVPILVHGDYDADGISATALLADTLAKWGGESFMVCTQPPSRRIWGQRARPSPCPSKGLSSSGHCGLRDHRFRPFTVGEGIRHEGHRH